MKALEKNPWKHVQEKVPGEIKSKKISEKNLNPGKKSKKIKIHEIFQENPRTKSRKYIPRNFSKVFSSKDPHFLFRKRNSYRIAVNFIN